MNKTPRKGIPHLEKMHPLDFYMTMAAFMDSDWSGRFRITEKVDGFPFRFGHSEYEYRRFFIETGWSGPISIPNFFKNWAKGKGYTDTKVKYMENLDQFHVYLKSFPMLGNVLLQYKDVKICCELLLNSNSEISEDKIKFIKIPYDKDKLGTTATIVILDVVNQYNEPHYYKDRIIRDLEKISTPELKFVKLENKENFFIDITKERMAFFNEIDNANVEDPFYFFFSRLHKDRPAKHQFKEITSKHQKILSDILQSNLKSVTGQFGNELEGLVFKSNMGGIYTSFKVVNESFKNRKCLWE